MMAYILSKFHTVRFTQVWAGYNTCIQLISLRTIMRKGGLK